VKKRISLLIVLSLLYAVDYESQIQPIFDTNCIGCHDLSSPGDLNLLSYDDFMPSSSVVPGDHTVSNLYDRITREESEEGDMPPSGSLSVEEIDLIADWIDEGALPQGSNDISGCTDPNAITCSDDINNIYFPECNTCDNGLLDPNVDGGMVFCDWFINESGVSDCDDDCPWDVVDGILYTTIFCTNCLSDNSCDNVDPVVAQIFDNIENDGVPPCILDCESSDPVPCDNYYNPEADVDNGSCMYNDIPSDEEFFIFQTFSGFDLDWGNFTPPVDILQYVLQRCLDPDGDTDGDGELEYENCTMLISPGTFYLETAYSDDIGQNDGFSKYTLYVHYPNNTYWGSAQGYYYYDAPDCIAGDVSNDGIINVLDIVALVNHILGSNTLNDLCAADLNFDGIINVIDIVSLVNIILS